MRPWCQWSSLDAIVLCNFKGHGDFSEASPQANGHWKESASKQRFLWPRKRKLWRRVWKLSAMWWIHHIHWWKPVPTVPTARMMNYSSSTMVFLSLGIHKCVLNGVGWSRIVAASNLSTWWMMRAMIWACAFWKLGPVQLMQISPRPMKQSKWSQIKSMKPSPNRCPFGTLGMLGMISSVSGRDCQVQRTQKAEMLGKNHNSSFW